jgi:hypothetical protein
MNALLTTAVVAACLFGSLLLGIRLRRLLPEHHLSADSKDAVKLAMGLVATMTALLLGLLVSSAKGTYDAQRTDVMQMATKVTFLDRGLALYGPEAADARVGIRDLFAVAVRGMWPGEAGVAARLGVDEQAGDAVYVAIQRLSPRDDIQRSLKAHAVTLAAELGELRTRLMIQSVPSISTALLVAVVSWLVVIFLGFSLLAPSNAMTTLALAAAVSSVVGAVFLILELDQPFTGLIRISSEPMLNALNRLGR